MFNWIKTYFLKYVLWCWISPTSIIVLLRFIYPFHPICCNDVKTLKPSHHYLDEVQQLASGVRAFVCVNLVSIHPLQRIILFFLILLKDYWCKHNIYTFVYPLNCSPSLHLRTALDPTTIDSDGWSKVSLSHSSKIHRQVWLRQNQ